MATRHNLPLQLTSFVGREQEQAAVRTLLQATRLLTLSGTGGAGKTRLALQVAAAVLDEYADGVWLIELAPVPDGFLVPQTVASILGVRELPGRPIAEVLPQALVAKQFLLLLDNCEHVLSACAELVYSLLQACPDIRVLTTTREPLNITGEMVWRIASLTLPVPQPAASLEQLRRSEAVRLFEKRARWMLPSISLSEANAPAIATICRRLDGMPLAIELAAARVKHLAIEQIASRLDDRFRLLTGGHRSAPTRQQTIRTTIDWSYDLLSEPEHLMFDRLSVFVGGWTLEAAEAVAAGGALDADATQHAIHERVGRAEALLRSGRSFLYETVRELPRSPNWSADVSDELSAPVRLASAHAAQSAAEVVDLMYTAGGTSSIYASSRLERCFRDVHVVTQHIGVAASNIEMVGQYLLGLGLQPRR